MFLISDVCYNFQESIQRRAIDLVKYNNKNIINLPRHTWNFNIASVRSWWRQDIMEPYQYFMFLGIFWCLITEKSRPAEITNWIILSTQGNLWQRPSPWTASTRVSAMISSLELVDQWCRRPRRGNNASVVMKCCKKMAAFHQKCHHAPMRNTWTWSNESSSLFLPVMKPSVIHDNCSSRGHTLLSWL